MSTESPYASYVLLSRKKNKLTMSTESPYASYVLLSKYPLTYKKNPQQKLATDFFVLFITLLNVNICNVTAEGVNNYLFQKRDAVVRMRNTPFFKRV